MQTYLSLILSECVTFWISLSVLHTWWWGSIWQECRCSDRVGYPLLHSFIPSSKYGCWPNLECASCHASPTGGRHVLSCASNRYPKLHTAIQLFRNTPLPSASPHPHQNTLCSFPKLPHLSKMHLHSPSCSCQKPKSLPCTYSSSLTPHIQPISKSCQLYLQNISWDSVTLLNSSSAHILIQVIIMFHLDCCSLLPYKLFSTQ